MHGPLLIFFFLGTSVVFAIISMIVAKSKGHPAWMGLLLGFLFSCFGLVAVLVMKPASAVTPMSPPPPPPPILPPPPQP